MFDVGFWELALLGIVALVVLGPERLPQVARTAGRMVARARSYASTFTDELDKQTRDVEGQSGIGSIREEFNRAKDEFKRASDDITSAGDKLKTDTDETLADIETSADATLADAQADAGETTAPVASRGAPVAATTAQQRNSAVEDFGDVDAYVDQYMQDIAAEADPDADATAATAPTATVAAPQSAAAEPVDAATGNAPAPDSEDSEVQGKTS